MSLTVRRVGPEAAATVHGVIRDAFATRPALDPPADALAETVESIAAALERGGGLLADVDGEPAGTLLFDPDPSDPAGASLFLRRFGVLPQHRHHGVAHQLVTAAALHGLGARELAVLAREELPATVGFWRDNGFVDTAHRPPYRELRRPLPPRLPVATADDMHALGRRIAEVATAGDLVLLTGELGAGKTTLTQGLAAGLEVRGGVTSPTFVIARVHPSLVGGPALVHVDAYRLGGLAELDDLDLDTDLDTTVTVVEWGAGMAESLSDSWLEVTIERALGDAAEPVAPGEPDPRVVTVTGRGPRWR